MTTCKAEGVEEPPEDLLQVGAAVEVRPKNIDELYYAAEITGVERDDSGEKLVVSYQVEYEDGGVEDQLPIDALLHPAERTEVFNDGVVRVVDGHASFQEKPVNARLMSFVESLHLIQSAVILKSTDPVAFDHRTQLFDVDQALACVVPIYLTLGTAPSKENTQEEEEVKVKIGVLGAGGATLPMALVRKHPTLLSITVVENNQNVLNCARGFFGAEASGLELVLDDGIQFLKEQEDASLDVLVVDVAAPGAAADDTIELPPAAFRDRESFELYDRKVQRRSGWVAMNVLATKDGLKEILLLSRERFRHVYVLATDPNYVFFLSNASVLHEQSISAAQVARAVSGARYGQDLAHSVLEEIKETAKNAEDKVMLGWFDTETFLKLLDESDII